jgi:hypothetical protein
LKEQFFLLGNLCFGRNYFCKKILKDRFPVSMLLKYIHNQELPPDIKASLVYLLIHIHIDTKPRMFTTLPNLNYTMSNIEEIDEKDEEDKSKLSSKIRTMLEHKSINMTASKSSHEQSSKGDKGGYSTV